MYCCKAIHCGNNVTVTETAVEITFADGATGIADTQPFNFRLCTAIPASGADLPVTFTVNGASVPLWDRYGNPVTGSGLTTRVNYCGFYGASTPHVISHTLPLRRCVC